MTLPAFAAERRAVAPLHDCRRSISPAGGRSAANPPHTATVVDRWDRQTDGRTDRCSTSHRPCSTYYAASVSKFSRGGAFTYEAY